MSGLLMLIFLVVFSGCEITVNPILTYHSVLFDSNGATGGSVPVFSINALVGSTMTVPNNTGNLEKEDHQFIGWNTNAEGTGNFFNPGEMFSMPAVNVVLYAAWERMYRIGQTGPAGGIIFYDKGDDSDGWRYLEAAPVETEWVDRIWGEQDAVVIEGTSNAIGSGKANTQKIVLEYLSTNYGNYAASLCTYLEHGGFDDWFLPSLFELDEMYKNLYLYSLGGFSNEMYWSSTADSSVDDNAFISYFATGQMTTSSTYSMRRVRAIRSF